MNKKRPLFEYGGINGRNTRPMTRRTHPGYGIPPDFQIWPDNDRTFTVLASWGRGSADCRDFEHAVVVAKLEERRKRGLFGLIWRRFALLWRRG
jgi:hypothetical protein